MAASLMWLLAWKENVLAAAQWQMRWWRCLHICHRHMLLFLENRCWLWDLIHRCSALLTEIAQTVCGIWPVKNGKYYYWNKCLVVVILQSDAENLGYLVFSQKLCCSHVGQAGWNSSTFTGWISLAFPTDTNVLKQQSLMALINLLIFWGWHTHVLVLIAVKIDADVPVPLKIVQFWFVAKSNFLFVL